jgi:hypothetical protein
MLRDLENPGAVRAVMFLVMFFVAAVIVVTRQPSIIHSDLHATIQSFLH